MKVTVAGLGYVGMANAVLLSKHHDVTAYDIDPVKVQLVRDRQSPIADELIEAALATGSARLSATTDPISAYRDAEVVIIATPTDYNSDSHYFDTSSVEAVIADILTVAGETKYLRHFTVAGDLDQKGRYRIQAYLSISGWTGRGETATFKVYDAFK